MLVVMNAVLLTVYQRAWRWMRYQAINILWCFGAEGQYKSFISFALITYLANFGTSQSLAITDFVRSDLNSEPKPHPHRT